jgi:hypothetical protein
VALGYVQSLRTLIDRLRVLREAVSGVPCPSEARSDIASARLFVQGSSSLLGLVTVSDKHVRSLLEGIEESIRTEDSEGLRSSKRHVETSIDGFKRSVDRLDDVRQHWTALLSYCTRMEAVNMSIPMQVCAVPSWHPAVPHVRL